MTCRRQIVCCSEGAGTPATMVRNNAAASRYELELDGRVVGIADYYDSGDVLVFPHTVVVPDMRGRGMGDMLVRGALDDVRAHGRRIRPSCWFVAEFVDANPEYADLIA